LRITTMNWINARITDISDLVLAPFASWSPLAVLIVLSAVFGVEPSPSGPRPS
jgi:hypothetical protein